MTQKNKKETIHKVPYYSDKGKKEGEFDLDRKLFTGEYKNAILYQAVVMYDSNKRAGLASTKVRNKVAGGGKKPWRQKGTGRARVGSIRNPIWRGGGIVFGPHPRDFHYQIPKRVKKLALVHGLNAKLKDDRFTVIKEISLSEPKTKKLKSLLDKLKLEGTILLTVGEKNNNLILSSRNIAGLNITLFSDLNVSLVLRHKNFLITEKGIELLTKRLKG